jgi:hypothetical protein
MSSSRRNSILASLVVGATVAAPLAHASCALEYTRVVRARFIRCESAQFYWDASGGDGAIHERIERELALSDPRSRDARRARIYQQLPQGPLGPQAKFVAVIHVDWQVTTTPWLPPVFTGPVELMGEPRKIGETFRYLWHGPAETCETPPTSGSSMDLWLTGPCCDTVITTQDGCVMSMSYVEPAPAPLREVLEKALEGR